MDKNDVVCAQCISNGMEQNVHAVTQYFMCDLDILKLKKNTISWTESSGSKRL